MLSIYIFAISIFPSRFSLFSWFRSGDEKTAAAIIEPLSRPILHNVLTIRDSADEAKLDLDKV